RLELVEEIHQDFGQRQVVRQDHARRARVLHVLEGAAAVVTQLHAAPDVFGRRDDGSQDVRLLDLLDQVRGRQVRRVVDLHHPAVRAGNPVTHAGTGGNQREVEFALEPLLNDLTVQQTEEAAAKAEAQRRRGLRLEGESCVVELQLLKRLAQIRIL